MVVCTMWRLCYHSYEEEGDGEEKDLEEEEDTERCQEKVDYVHT